MKKTVSFLFICICIMIIMSFAVMAMLETDEEGNPAVVDNGSSTTNIDSDKKIYLPPGFKNVRIIPKENEDLPPDMTEIGEEINVVGSEDNTDSLPEDMKDILESGGEEGSSSNGVNSGNDSSYSASETGEDNNGNTVTVTSPPAGQDSQTGKFLWFIMGILICILLVAGGYVFFTRKDVNLAVTSADEN